MLPPRVIVDILARQEADRRCAHVAEVDDNRLGRQPRRIERAAPDEARQFRRYDDRALMCHRTAGLSRSAWGEAPLESREKRVQFGGRHPGHRGQRPWAPRADRCRPETRRVGKEWVSSYRSRWSPYHSNKNITYEYN